MKKKIDISSSRLRRLRRERCLSQQELVYKCEALQIPISLATIKRAERGSSVNYITVRKLAKFFQVEPIYLIEEQ